MTGQAPKTVYLISSGPTGWQDQNRLQGDTDLPLSPRGEIESQALAAQWNPPAVRTIYCAPDEASRQTAALFAAQLKTAKVRPVDELAEINLGLWQGLTESQVMDRYRSAFTRWRQDPATVSIPQGESVDEALDRMAVAVLRLLDRNGEPIVLVLRPLLLELCTQWMVEQLGQPLTRSDASAVRRFEFDHAAIESLRSILRRKRVSA